MWAGGQQKNWQPQWELRSAVLGRKNPQGISELLSPVGVLRSLDSLVCSPTNLSVVSTVHQPLARLRAYSDEGKEPSEGQEGQGGRPGFQPEWLIRGP